jgi:uncharacterized membrane protein
MTPDQVTRRRARAYALIGAGLAAFAAAYQFAFTQSSEGPWPVFMPVLFAVIGVVLIAVSIVMLMQTKGEKAASPTPIEGPQKKIVQLLLIVGFLALIGSVAVNYLAPDGDLMWLSISVALLLVMGVCFIVVARIARKAKAVQAK